MIEQGKQGSTVAMVTPQYANGASFPFSVGLPLWVCQAAKMGRQIVIAGPDQSIPLVIAEWMAEDHRYCDKLVEGQSFTAAPALEPEPEVIRKLVQDNFTVIRGVGPAVTEKLYNADINTFEQLADGDTAYLVKLLGKPMTDTKVERIKNDALDIFNANN